MLNPHNATITVNPPNVTQFRLKYLAAGQPIAELVVSANYVTNADYVQSLTELNALVTPQFETEPLTLTASSINAGGESSATACSEVITVVNAPNAPSNIAVS